MNGPLDLEIFLQDEFSAQAYANVIIEGRGAAATVSPDPIPPSSSAALNNEKAVTASEADSPSLQSPKASRVKVQLPVPEDASWRAQLSPSVKTNAVENDVSSALSQLNIALDDVGRSIKEEVTQNSSTLINEANEAVKMEEELAWLCEKVVHLQTNTREMKRKVTDDYDQLNGLDSRIQKLQQATELIRKALGFVLLYRRLDAQMKEAIPNYAQEDTDGAKMGTLTESADETPGDGQGQASENVGQLARAAGTLKAIEDTISTSAAESAGPSIVELNFVKRHLARMEEVRVLITEHMEEMIVQGLKELSPSLLNESLQTALNLGTLPELVQDLLTDLTDVVRERTRNAFDIASIVKDVSSRSSSKTSNFLARRTADSAQFSAQEAQRFSALTWKRIQTLFLHEMPAVCKKVYTLEKVLGFKRAEDKGSTLLDQAMTLLGEKPSLLFWRTLAESLEQESNKAMQESQPFRRALDEGFPQLLLIFKDFFSRVALYTDTVYTFEKQSPETVMLVGRLSALSNGYVARVASRLDDAIATSFSSRNVPGHFEGSSFGQLVGKELEQVKDPLLMPTMVNVVERAVQNYVDRIIHLRSNTPLNLAAGQVPSAQLRNADLASAVYAVLETIKGRDGSSFPPIAAFSENKLPSFEHTLDAFFFAPFLQAAQDQLQVPIARMQYNSETMAAKTASPYVADLSDRLAALRDLVLPKYHVGQVKQAWVITLADKILAGFVQQVNRHKGAENIRSSARFSADVAETEFATSQLLASIRSRDALQMKDCQAYEAFHSLRQ